MKKQGIILAAGKGSRMPDSEIPKVLYKLDGRVMIKYLIESFNEAGIKKPIVVVGYKKQMVKKVLGDTVEYVCQKKQLGTGDAVKAAHSKLEDKGGVVLIAYGDMPLWSSRTIKKLFDKQKKTDVCLTMATVKLPDSFAYGRIIRDDRNNLKEVVEEKDCSKKQLKIKEKNPGLYLAKIGWLFNALKKIKPNNAQNEYYLTDIIEIAVNEGKKIETIEVKNKEEAMGVNTKEDYEAVKSKI